MISRYEVTEISKIWTDQYKFETYLKYELALIKALETNNICKKGISEEIKKVAKVNPKRIEEIEKSVKHDVIAFCSSITEQLNEDLARYFHFGVTSSDVIDSSTNILIKESLDYILVDFKKLLNALSSFADNHKNILAIGRSHGITAEPLSLGGKFLGFYSEFYRRFIDLKNFHSHELTIQCSGAVGNYTIISTTIEEEVSKILRLPVEPLSTQIIPRDRIVKLMGIIASIGAAIDRLCIELRHLQHSNINEISEGFSKGQKGSSTMPHKKNPISAENLSGISRLLKSYFSVALENNNLWHERDISHSSAERFILPDSLGLLSYALKRLTTTVENLVTHEEIIAKNIPESQVFLSSYILHQLLIKTNLRREQLYTIVQEAAFETLNKNISYEESILKALIQHKITDKEILSQQKIDLKEIYLKEINAIFDRVYKNYPKIIL